MSIKDMTTFRDGPTPREVLHKLLDYAIDNDLSHASAEQMDGCTNLYRRYRIFVEAWERTLEPAEPNTEE